MHEHQRDYVLRTVEERGIRLVRLWFTDVLGNLKSFAISPAEMENALNDGMSFDGVTRSLGDSLSFCFPFRLPGQIDGRRTQS